MTLKKNAGRACGCDIKTRVFCAVGVSFVLLLARPSNASSVVCGVHVTFLDCRSVPAEYEWAPDSQLTFGIGCIGYPTPGPPGDASVVLPNFFLPDVSSQRFKIEAGGQDLTGGTFSDAGIRCGWPCDYDAGWRSCDPMALVRYTGPLLPGQQHKITWMNSGINVEVVPYALFTVSSTPAVDSGFSSDTGVAVDLTLDLPSADRLSSADLFLLPGTDAQAEAVMAVDTAGGPDRSSPSENDGDVEADVAADFAQAGDLPLLATKDASAEDVDAGTGPTGPDGATRRNQSSSGCSCTVGARKPTSLGAVPLVALLAFARRRRGRTIS